MRSNKQWYYLVLLLFFLVLVVPVPADPEQHQPTLIIPTKYRYLLLDMVQSIEKNTNQVSLSTPATVSSPSPSQAHSGSPVADENALAAALTPDSSSSGYGRGFVQTNFDVSFDESGRRIDNHERLTARGLFDIHVTHALN